MELNGEQLISAPIPDVWRGLNDIDVLARSIPGCEEISRISPEELGLSEPVLQASYS
jgi:carbon monoxide dehydrogenase subunit G